MITDREPFIFLERACISVSGKSVIAKTKDGNINLPISSIHCLMLGNGTSVTADAAALCAKHNCYIAFLKGGSNVHSVWHCGRYQNPVSLVRQVQKYANPIVRLNIAKTMIVKRLSYMDEEFKELLSTDRIEKCETIEELLGVEGNYTRKIYAIMSNKTFKRDFNSNEGVNGRLSLLNNALYNFTTTILLSLGYSPSVGFLHGQTRRGGLTFDIVDIFKFPLCTKEAFSDEHSDKELLRVLSKKLNQQRKFWVKEIITVTQEFLC